MLLLILFLESIMENKKKVLHVLTNMQIGGISKFVLDLCYYQRLCEDVEVGVYVYSDINPQWDFLFKELGVRLYYGYGTKSSTLSHFKRIKSQYDIVHWHSFIPLLSCCTLFDKEKHIFTHHSVLGYGRKKNYVYHIKWKLFKLFINNIIDVEVYNSNYTKEFWQNWGAKAKSNILIYNGLRFKDYNDTVKVDLGGKYDFIVGTTSNFIKYKRIDLLIEAFASWSKDKGNVLLLLVGDGAEKKELMSLVDKLNISNKVFFSGHKSDIFNYQKLMDVCVFPSSTETFGLAALECLHLGKPVVVMSDGGGICEVVGFESLDTVNDISGISDRIDYYYNLNSEGRRQLVQTFVERSYLFDMKVKSIEYVKLYLSLFI